MTLSPRRAGFSLLEAVVCMFGLGVAMAAGILLLSTTLKANRLSDQGMTLVRSRSELADQFRADVARARATPQQRDSFQRGPDCLILARDDRSAVVYQFRDGKLTRHDLGPNNATRRDYPIGGDHSTIRFEEGPLVRLKIEDRPPTGLPRSLEIAAALGGDRR